MLRVNMLAPFLIGRRRKPSPAREVIVTPGQTTASSVLVLFTAVWPAVTLLLGGYPSSFGAEFVFLMCATVSILMGPVLVACIVVDLVRNRSRTRLIPAFVLSLAAVLVSWGLLYLRIHGYDFHA
jgi:hypothetical protein